MSEPDPHLLLFRFRILTKLARLVLPTYRFKWPQVLWWKDIWFSNYLDRFNETKGHNTDRKWMLAQLMRLVDAVPGDTVELGVYRGASSFLMCSVNAHCKAYKRCHHMFDSFEGLSQPNSLDGTHWSLGDLSCSEDEARKNLSDFADIKFYKGWIPKRFYEVASLSFAFVHIDVDLYQPTLDGLCFFYDKVNAGGIILCDDYGFSSCPGATKACQEFFNDKPEKMISLSDGGGFIIKGCQTAAPLGLL